MAIKHLNSWPEKSRPDKILILISSTFFRFAYDFEVASMLRESVVPRAILYFTGDAEDDEDEFEDEMEPGMDEE